MDRFWPYKKVIPRFISILLTSALKPIGLKPSVKTTVMLSAAVDLEGSKHLRSQMHIKKIQQQEAKVLQSP